MLCLPLIVNYSINDNQKSSSKIIKVIQMEWFKILPPLVAVAIVLWKKEVILALLLSIFVSEWLLITSNGLMAPVMGSLNTLERIAAVFTDPGNTRILIFSLLVGALLAYMRSSGGVNGLVKSLISKGFAKSP